LFDEPSRGNRVIIGALSVVGDRGFRENITQIIWPCKLQPGLEDGPAHARLQLLARKILGQDMDIYFDHMICKVRIGLWVHAKFYLTS